MGDKACGPLPAHHRLLEMVSPQRQTLHDQSRAPLAQRIVTVFSYCVRTVGKKREC